MGWASGFSAGTQLARGALGAYEQGREMRQREELAKAYGLAPQEQQAPLATPEQLAGAQAETRALAAQDAEMFGLAPQEMQRYAPAMPQEGARTGMSTYRLGEQVLQRAPTQAEIDMARMRAAADVYGRFGDAARREELMRGLRAEQRAQTAEERAAQQFETQQQEAALRIAETQRLATERANTDLARKDLAERKAKGPLTMQDFNEIGAKYNLDPTKFVQADEVLETKQIKDTKRALSQAAMRGEDGLNAFLADKFDPDKSDNIVPKLTKDRAGNIVVTYGDRVLQEYGAHKNVMSLVGGVINLIDQNPFETLKTLSELDYKAAAAEAQRATTQLRGIQGRAILDKAGADVRQQDYNDRANALIEGYQAAMALGPQGRQAAAIYAQEYDQLRATTPRGLTRAPALAALNAAQRAEKPEKPVDVPEAGKRVTIGGRLMQTDGYGGYVSAKGVLPDEQATVLKKAGIPDNYASRIMWNNDSDAVMFNGKEYNPLDKRDMNELKDDLKAFDVMNQRIAEEARMRANPPAPSGFQGARTTGLGPATTYGVRPGAESIYGR